MTSVFQRLPFVLIATFVLVGCREKDTGNASADSAAAGDSAAVESDVGDTVGASSETQPATATTPTESSSRPVTVQDIDHWEEGMAGEMRAVRETGAKMKTATSTEDKLSLMMAMTEASTASAGAEAAGLDEERYKFVRSKLSDVVKYLAPMAEMGLDTTKMPAKQLDQFRTQRDAYLKQTEWAVPADVVEALKPRAAELRNKDMELVGARLPGGR